MTIIDIAQPASAQLDQDDLLEMYRRMFLIRNFEERTAALYAAGVVPGFVHVSVGQEASSVGICWPLRRTDGITSTHRGHGHCLAKGASVFGMYSELMGKATGTGRGLGGSMHIADFEMGVYGANGIVAAGLPIAVGVAQGFRQQGRDDVVVAFFGDGAIAQGAFHEAVNLASLWKLPVLFACENNGYSEFSTMESQHPVPIVDRAAAYGIEAFSVDGNNVIEVASVVETLVTRMRAGEGPFLLESVTYRRRGHYEGDATKYRDKDEVEVWKLNDPIDRMAATLDGRGLADERREIERQVLAELETAEAQAQAAPFPDPATYQSMVTSPRPEYEEGKLPPADPENPSRYKYQTGITDALRLSLEGDPLAFLAGIDVGDGGNIFGLTRGLIEQFPNQVFDTPISESAIVGLAVGAAMTGCKPIVELMYSDFMSVAFDQLINQAAKLHFMTGGRAPMSLVVRTQFGSGKSSAAQHSQSLEALLAHIPGLTVVMPSTAADAYGLLRAAFLDPNPVIFIEHRLMYGKKGVEPPTDHLVPIGKAAIRREGTDVTVVSWSRMVDWAEQAAELAAAEGISVEVIDLRTISPFDEQAIIDSVRKTEHLVIAHEAVISGGLGAEIAARVSDKAVWNLDAPIRRVAPPFSPAPYSPPLEAAWLPGPQEILDAIRDVYKA